jgi:hypothetical protein
MTSVKLARWLPLDSCHWPKGKKYSQKEFYVRRKIFKILPNYLQLSLLRTLKKIINSKSNGAEEF